MGTLLIFVWFERMRKNGRKITHYPLWLERYGGAKGYVGSNDFHGSYQVFYLFFYFPPNLQN